MGMGQPTPPQPPGMTPEELNLLSKERMTVDQLNQILQGGTTNSQDAQRILQQISGLYKPVTTPSRTIKGQTTYSSAPDTESIQRYLDTLTNNSRIHQVGVNGPNGLVMLSKDQLTKALNDPETAKQYGLVKTVASTTPDQVIPESTTTQLDPQALQDLTARVAAENSSQQAINDAASKRYLAALNGQAPLSQGLLQRKADDFRALKEGAAQRGIRIDGDTPEGATSGSSAGTELIGQFNRTYGLLADQERQSALAGPVPSNNTESTSLGYATSNPTMGLLPGYSGLANSYSGLLQPYVSNQMLGYQGQLYNYGQQSNYNSGLLGLTGYAGVNLLPKLFSGTSGLMGAGSALSGSAAPGLMTSFSSFAPAAVA